MHTFIFKYMIAQCMHGFHMEKFQMQVHTCSDMQMFSVKPCEKCEGTVGAAKARLIFPIFTLESFEPHPSYL